MNVSDAAREKLIEFLRENDEEEAKVRISQVTVGGG